MKNTRTETYYDLLDIGLKYEKYVKSILADQMKIKIDIIDDQMAQQLGETWQGIEIKYDRKYAHTGNMYIEVAERGRQGQWVPAGVYRKDNTWLWAMGDYETIYLLAKRQLQRYVQQNWHRIIVTDTSQGVLIDQNALDLLAVHIIKCEKKNEI